MGIDRLSFGRMAEDEAEAFFRSNGYEIVKRNFSCPYGEIDLIVRNKEFLVFVEVRARTKGGLTIPEETITYHKRQRIIKTARFFIMKYDIQNISFRFDCLFITRALDGRILVNHIKSAFECDYF